MEGVVKIILMDVTVSPDCSANVSGPEFIVILAIFEALDKYYNFYETSKVFTVPIF